MIPERKPEPPPPHGLCASCGNPVLLEEAWTADRCGLWHRYCIPTDLLAVAKPLPKPRVPYLWLVK